jgi:hypothetical protein
MEMSRRLFRRLWLLPLVALAFAGLSCEKETEARFKTLYDSPFTIAPGTHKDLPFSVTPEMTEVPDSLNNITLYVEFAIPFLDTVSVYVLTDDNYYAFTQHLPFTSLQAFHGATDADFWYHHMTGGDYHVVLDHLDTTSTIQVSAVKIHMLYFAWK